MGLHFRWGGMVTNLDIHGPIRLQAEFLLTGFGVRVIDQTYGNYKRGIIYFKVPIDVLYMLKAGPGNFQLGVGPYIAKALYGVSRDAKMSFGNNTNNDMRGGDWGIDGRAEYITQKGLFVSLDYDAGLENVLPAAQPGNAIRNYDVDLSLGIFFIRRYHKGEVVIPDP